MSIMISYRHRLYAELQTVFENTTTRVMLAEPDLKAHEAVWLGPALPNDSEATSLTRPNGRTVRTEDFRQIVLIQVTGHSNNLAHEKRAGEIEDLVSNLIDTNASGWDVPQVKSAHIEAKRFIVHPVDMGLVEIEIEIMVKGHTRYNA